jgi:hypothetical protein
MFREGESDRSIVFYFLFGYFVISPSIHEMGHLLAGVLLGLEPYIYLSGLGLFTHLGPVDPFPLFTAVAGPLFAIFVLLVLDRLNCGFRFAALVHLLLLPVDVWWAIL